MSVQKIVRQRLDLQRARLQAARKSMGDAGPDDALAFAAIVKAHYAVIQELEDLLEEINDPTTTAVRPGQSDPSGEPEVLYRGWRLDKY